MLPGFLILHYRNQTAIFRTLVSRRSFCTLGIVEPFLFVEDNNDISENPLTVRLKCVYNAPEAYANICSIFERSSMFDEYIVFPKLNAYISVRGFRIQDLARRLRISRTCLYNKMHGLAPFTLDEAIKLKEILSANIPLEVLFKPGKFPRY